MSDRFVWLTIFLLGCYHGINPGMGWLFSVALGFQARRATAVLAAIVPLALGHVVSVALVVFVAIFAAFELPRSTVHLAAAAILIGFGIYRLIRARHVRWVGMRVGFWGLALWGFLMSTAHGAGLMLVPFVTASHGIEREGWLMVSVHTLGYLLTTATVALFVYGVIGVRFLRTAWVNVDLLWAVALIVTGVIALFA